MGWFSSLATTVLGGVASSAANSLLGGSSSSGTSSNGTSKSSEMAEDFTGLMSPNMAMKDSKQRDFLVAETFGTDPHELANRVRGYFPKEEEEEV